MLERTGDTSVRSPNGTEAPDLTDASQGCRALGPSGLWVCGARESSAACSGFRESGAQGVSCSSSAASQFGGIKSRGPMGVRAAQHLSGGRVAVESAACSSLLYILLYGVSVKAHSFLQLG